MGEEELAALKAVIDSGWITMGESVRNFEDKFGSVHGADHAVAVSSATTGLHLCLAALGIGEGHEVLVPSLTFVASANVALYQGATPVLVDIESIRRPHISLEDARGKLTARTKAIIVVHYGGWMCPMKEWRAFADEHGLILVEDAAHAPGLPGVAVYGDAAVFSFYGNKNMTTAEGGMVLSGNDQTASRVRRLRSHGMTTQTLERYSGHEMTYDVTDLGYNYRMDELRAAIGLVQLDKVHRWNEKRAELLQHYRDNFFDKRLDVEIPFDERESTAGHLCPALLPTGIDRERVMRRLREVGIHSSVHYPPIHQFTYYRSKIGPQCLPNTEQYAERELSLPLHPAMSFGDVDDVVWQLESCLTLG